MSRKRYSIVGLTLTLILLCSTAAYASWTTTISSKFTSLSTTVGGYSYTSSSEVSDTIEAYSYLYENDVYKDSDSQKKSNATWAQGDVSANNELGIQTWKIEGVHRATKGSYGFYDTTSVTKNT